MNKKFLYKFSQIPLLSVLIFMIIFVFDSKMAFASNTCDGNDGGNWGLTESWD